MTGSIKSVRFGMLIGLLCLILGIGWAVWLVVGHERIHQSLEGIAERAGKGAHAVEMHDARENEKIASRAKIHIHKDGAQHEHAAPVPPKEEEKGHEMMQGHAHDDPIMVLSHTRLVRGHLHAMGLGLATILISLVLAFTDGSEKIKAVASVSTGIGGIIYPLAWVVMGYSTPALGPEGAEASVIFIAGPGVGLVLLGVFTAAFFLLRDILTSSSEA